MKRLFDLLIGFIIVITGVITALLLYPFYFKIDSGAMLIIALLIPLLFGIVGVGWVLGGWAGVGAAIGELGLRFRIWLLMHLLYGDKEFLIDLMLIQYVLMNIYEIPYELSINGHEVIIKAPLSRDASIRLMNYLNQRMNKLLIISVEPMKQ
ncbi:hypothetical protein [Vulcanisaeta sp. JCM 16159]|uniref:hypothetical protein n=1 Tax=Vulcanisaeta sp. JCM 16159 TaxID=1295371 RepID=UPI0006D1F68B|nr:hypothetical protein [Vulcanisaeta sp. JCM 16159]